MATITPTVEKIDSSNGHAYIVTWEQLTENDTAAAVELIQFSDRSVQITGTFGGDAVTLQGSNDGSTFATLNDPFGDPISMSAAGISGIAELTRWVRPGTPAGSSADVDVFLVINGPQPR